MPAPKTPQARLFVAQVRANDPSAIDQIKRALIRNDGNVQKTAKDLGIGERAIYRWGDEIDAVAAVLEQHRRGRIGRGPSVPKEPPPKPAKRARKKML